MTTALIYLGWTLLLVIVQIVVASAAKRRQDGMQWASGNRDTKPSAYTGLAGRMERAQANLLETLPVFIGAILLSHSTGCELDIAAWAPGSTLGSDHYTSRSTALGPCQQRVETRRRGLRDIVPPEISHNSSQKLYQLSARNRLNC